MSTSALKIGLIGCGAIGRFLSKSIDQGKVGKCELVAIYDNVPSQVKELYDIMRHKPRIDPTIDPLIDDPNIDLVFEAASPEAVKEYTEKVLSSEKHIIIMSSGALVDREFRRKIERLADSKGKHIYLPSGGVVGIDGIKSAGLVEVFECSIVSTRTVSSLRNSVFAKHRNFDLDSIETPTVVYEGTAEEAVNLFPHDVNSMATVGLAWGFPEKTMVRIVADPSIEGNLHQILLKGTFGQFEMSIRNTLAPESGKTAFITALSAVAKLKKITETIQIGT
jgi:aspartate dehydrogenase